MHRCTRVARRATCGMLGRRPCSWRPRHAHGSAACPAWDVVALLLALPACHPCLLPSLATSLSIADAAPAVPAVRAAWRPSIEDPSTLQLFIDFYIATQPPLSSMALECLVRARRLDARPADRHAHACNRYRRLRRLCRTWQAAWLPRWARSQPVTHPGSASLPPCALSRRCGSPPCGARSSPARQNAPTSSAGAAPTASLAWPRAAALHSRGCDQRATHAERCELGLTLPCRLLCGSDGSMARRQARM